VPLPQNVAARVRAFPDEPLADPRDHPAMRSYPVVWRIEADAASLIVGRLEIDEAALVLHGGRRGDERRLVIPRTAIRSASGDNGWLGRLRSIAVDVQDIGRVSLATTAGLMIRHEILEQLQLAATAAV